MTEITEQTKQYRKQWYIDNKPHSQAYSRLYRESRKEESNVRSRAYYVDNLAAIKEWQQTKHACSCGGRYTNANKTHHLRTKLHIDSLVVELE